MRAAPHGRKRQRQRPVSGAISEKKTFSPEKLRRPGDRFLHSDKEYMKCQTRRTRTNRTSKVARVASTVSRLRKRKTARESARSRKKVVRVASRVAAVSRASAKRS